MSDVIQRAAFDLTVNGQVRHLDLDLRTTLLDALRETLGLTGSKKGCDHGQCGACTVLVNGRRINACLSLAVMHEGEEVTTIEGIGLPGNLHPLQLAFLDRDAFQCGYCTPGQICSAMGMLFEIAAGEPSQESDLARHQAQLLGRPHRLLAADLAAAVPCALGQGAQVARPRLAPELLVPALNARGEVGAGNVALRAVQGAVVDAEALLEHLVAEAFQHLDGLRHAGDGLFTHRPAARGLDRPGDAQFAG